MFADTHAHIYSEYYDDIKSVLDNAKANNVDRVLNCATNLANSKEILNLTRSYENMFGAIGIHPEEVEAASLDDLNFLEDNLKHKKIVAIGEIGLDYYWRKDNKEKQIEFFKAQLDLAEKYQLPVIIHSREATDDMVKILKNYKLKGVIHSFSGSIETANEYIKLGYVLGINGVVTFKNCKLKEVIDKLSTSYIILETDSPYLTPVPYRGTKNEPKYILEIAKFISEIKGIELNELATITNTNIARIFDF